MSIPALATVVVAVPFVAALVDLHHERWYPGFDRALAELRVRDVGGAHTPLIGMPGRIGEYPHLGSHPGPLSFYLLAPLYRVLGSTSWALQAGTAAIHVAAIASAVWIGHRRAGWRGVIGVAALLTVVVRGYGQLLLTDPWNPYLPLLAWIVVLLAAWSVLCGDSLMLIPLVVAGSLCAQSHVSYLVPVGALTLGAVAVTAWRLLHPADEPTSARHRRAVFIAATVGVVLWLPPMIDQLLNDPGNVRLLLDHFGHPPEAPIGVGAGLRLALRHFDAWAGFSGASGGLAGNGRFVTSSVTWRGGAMLVVWLAAAALAWRLGPPALRHLHAIVAVAFVVGVVSMTRIFGQPWFYLTLWAWGTTALAVGAVIWTLAVALRRCGVDARRRALPAFAALVAVFAVITSTASFADAEVPEPDIGAAVGALAGPTYDAIARGVGPATGSDAAYQVRWSDAAYIGGPGVGLFNELERRGLDVSADEYFRVPMTEHRVRPRQADVVQIHVATGGYIDAWRQVPGAVQVAFYEPRSADEVARYDELHARVVERLRIEGLDDVADIVDTNLFGASLDHACRPPTLPTSPCSSTSVSRWRCSSPPPTPIRDPTLSGRCEGVAPPSAASAAARQCAGGGRAGGPDALVRPKAFDTLRLHAAMTADGSPCEAAPRGQQRARRPARRHHRSIC